MDAALEDFIEHEINQSIATKSALLNAQTLAEIQQIAQLVIASFKQGGKLLIAGNGGSAADAQHLAAEFIGRYKMDRDPLPCIALTTDTSVLTAVSNDLGYDKVLVRQLQALARPGDIFAAISTSGNSANIVAALRQCREQQVTTIGLTGAEGGTMSQFCDVCVKVPSRGTPRIQECHILVGHILCAAVEKSLFGEKA